MKYFARFVALRLLLILIPSASLAEESAQQSWFDRVAAEAEAEKNEQRTSRFKTADELSSSYSVDNAIQEILDLGVRFERIQEDQKRQQSIQKKMRTQQCIIAFGHPKYCNCLVNIAPKIPNFTGFVYLTLFTVDELIHSYGMPPEKKSELIDAKNTAISARDFCVNRYVDHDEELQSSWRDRLQFLNQHTTASQ